MASVTYTAKRNLAPTHTPDSEYSIDFGVQQATPMDKPIGQDIVSMGGAISSKLERIDQEWSVSTVLIVYTDIAVWREFVHSVSARETFTFDPEGTAAVPSAFAETVYLKSKSVKYTRQFNYMKISFVVVASSVSSTASIVPWPSYSRTDPRRRISTRYTRNETPPVIT